MARGRATNGSGHIAKLKGRSKPYQIQYTVDGVRKYKGGFASHAEAAAELRKITASVDSHEYVDPQKMKLSEWLEVWQLEYCGDVKASTMVQYEGYIKNHINPVLGKVKLCDLKSPQVQSFVNRLTRKGKGGDKPLAYKTKKNIHGCLSTALEKAKEIKYIKENPASGCTIPRSDDDTNDKEVHPLESEQIPAFMEAIKGTRFERIYFIAIGTGMRLSEILGLQWGRVKEKTDEVVINKQLAIKRKAGSQRILTSTKSRNTRTIVVPEDVITVLRPKGSEGKSWRVVGE